MLRLSAIDLATPEHRGRMPTKPTSVRAAAVSATQLLVQRATLDLDADQDEFEALAPRLSIDPVSGERPVIHIADTLVNGSGFSRRLAEEEGRPLADLFSRALFDLESWPLKAVLQPEHVANCNQSCYLCLQRYGNRRLHGLLDWRYGLGFLRAMWDPNHVCGLDGDFSAPELTGWAETVRQDLRGIGAYFGERVTFDERPIGLPRMQVGSVQVTAVHPLWHQDRARDVLADGDPDVLLADAFELARRPIRIIELIRRRL